MPESLAVPTGVLERTRHLPGAFVLPSTLAVDKTSIPYFQEFVHPDFDVEYLLFVANQYGNHLVNVYAFGSFPEGYRLAESQIGSLPETDESTGIAPVGEVTISSRLPVIFSR